VHTARKVMMNDPTAALTMARELERRVANSPDEAGRWKAMAKARWIAGEAMLRLNRIDEARRLIDSSYSSAVASRDLQSQGDFLLSRGSIKMESGDPAGALKDFVTAYQLFVRTGDARSRPITLQDLAALYTNAQEYGRAELCLRQAAEA
jgi:tetratricopeptide (TPR) repeat protein